MNRWEWAGLILLPLAGGLVTWFAVGLWQQAACNHHRLPHRLQSLWKAESCQVEVRPGQWASPREARQIEELCK